MNFSVEERLIAPADRPMGDPYDFSAEEQRSIDSVGITQCTPGDCARGLPMGDPHDSAEERRSTESVGARIARPQIAPENRPMGDPYDFAEEWRRIRPNKNQPVKI